jgi:phenylpyruvate tautomerase PptA (4-oxalocrotonate tautomerase family)
MSMTLPASVPVEGTRRVFSLPTVADINAITVAEINAGTFIGCYVTTAGWQPSQEQATIPDGRLCSSQDFERPGRKTKTLALQYTYNLNEAEDDEARIALAEGTTHVLVNVLQKDEDEDDVAVGDWYEAWPVQAGEQVVMAVETNAIDRIQQKQFVRGKVVHFKQVVAA